MKRPRAWWWFCSAALSLCSCGGTAIDYQGPLCGSSSPASLQLADQKDRAGFQATCRRTTYAADGTIAFVDEVTISTSESSASSAIAAQAQALGALAGVLARTAVTAPLGPLGTTVEF